MKLTINQICGQQPWSNGSGNLDTYFAATDEQGNQRLVVMGHKPKTSFNVGQTLDVEFAGRTVNVNGTAWEKASKVKDGQWGGGGSGGGGGGGRKSSGAVPLEVDKYLEAGARLFVKAYGAIGAALVNARIEIDPMAVGEEAGKLANMAMMDMGITCVAKGSQGAQQPAQGGFAAPPQGPPQGGFAPPQGGFQQPQQAPPPGYPPPADGGGDDIPF